MEALQTYLQHVNKAFQSGVATEHSYRGYLQTLIEAIAPDISATNEPKRQKCGAPDYILMRKEIPIGYIEAKDVGDKDLDGQKAKGGHKEQFDRYKHDLSNLIFTDYIDFRFYRDGKCYSSCQIADIVNNQIVSLTENFDQFISLIKNFVQQTPLTITNSAKLADMMATKARLLGDIIERAITNDLEADETSSLLDQMNAFKHLLIHDVTPKSFANVYAQTIAFGLFAARLHDPTLEDFSRQEAAELIPKTNPFLRGLFGYIAGPDIDQRILWVVNELVEIFLATNIRDILKDYGADTQTQDPIVHFYETFLSIYDAKERKDRGVWYTPKPVVKFIVNAVDEILKKHFGLPDGLRDSSTIEIEIPGQVKKTKITKTVSKVQILDPATGTGTFLAETIKFLHKSFKYNQGMWSNYVENHLIDRIYGFEILMASYTLAHIKCEILLRQTGYTPKEDKRFNIYLTNTLEKYNDDAESLFSTWLSVEARKADLIKRDAPVMVVMGNPPYSGESANKGEWTKQLIAPYYIEPFSEEKLKEKNPKWLNDDYVKFLRYAQTLIDRNKCGIVAFINNHSFLDNPTFRGMRYSLMKSFDYIYVLDLHGNTKKAEKCADGSADENVFNIQQGVSINLFVKLPKENDSEKKSKKKHDINEDSANCKVYYAELKGTRKQKYDILNQFSSIPEFENISENNLQNLYSFNLTNNSSIFNIARDMSISDDFIVENTTTKGIIWKAVPLDKKMCYFVPKSFKGHNLYQEYISVKDLFIENSVGIVTSKDKFAVQPTKEALTKRIDNFYTKSDYSNLKPKQIELVKQDLDKNYPCNDKIQNILYRLFDERWIFYSGMSNGICERSRYDVMKHMLSPNYGLVLCRQVKSGGFYHVFITNRITESSYLSNQTSEIGSVFPLYLYPDSRTIENKVKTTNIQKEALSALLKNTGLLADDVLSEPCQVTPITVLDYIYGVLHSMKYRAMYQEQLMAEFPRVPAPVNLDYMLRIAALGEKLRQLHLMEIPIQPSNNYPIDGDNVISTNAKFQFYHDDCIWINQTQYFEGVTQDVWDFQIGCYHPLEKWLKDRRGRALNYTEITHYQKILTVIKRTISYMNELDNVIMLPE